MKTRAKFTRCAMAAAILAAAPVLAAGLSGLPPAQTQNGITYVTGGIGQPASTAMRAAAGRYSLMTTFAQRNGAFLNDIRVNITDRHGNSVLDILSGPILLVDLPPGWYKLRASFNGKTLVRTVDVRRGHNHALAYAWPNDIESGSEFAGFEPLPGEEIPPPHPTTNLVAPPVPGPAPKQSDGVIRHWDPLIYDNVHYYTH